MCALKLHMVMADDCEQMKYIIHLMSAREGNS